MFQITEKQAEGIKYMIELMYENAAKKIIHANEQLNKDFEYAYSCGYADEKCKQEMIKKICLKFNNRVSNSENLREVVVDFLNNLFKIHFNWYASTSTSIASNRHKQLQKEALSHIIESIGDLCPIIERGTNLKPIFD